MFLDSADHCVARVKQRVRRGGHHVPEDDIRRRFSRSCTNFWQLYRKIADQWDMLYNSTGGYLEVAFGISDEIAVSDEELFQKFIAFGEGESNG